MKTLIKGVITGVLISFATLGFTGLFGETDGDVLSLQGNTRPELSNYIQVIKSQSMVAFNLTELEACEDIIETTLPFQSNYKDCENRVKATYSKIESFL